MDTADPGLGAQTVKVHLLPGLTEAHGVFPEAQTLWAPRNCPGPTKRSGSGRWRGRTRARHGPALLALPPPEPTWLPAARRSRLHGRDHVDGGTASTLSLAPEVRQRAQGWQCAQRWALHSLLRLRHVWSG